MGNESQGEASFVDQVGTTVFIMFMACISLMGALTNAMVVFSIFANQNLRTRTNYIVLSLAVSDFFVATVAIPLRLLGDLNGSKANLVSCNVVMAFTILFDGLSRLNIVLLTLERYTAVRFPYWHERNASKRTVLIAVVVCWTVMGTFAIFLMSGVGIRNEKDENNKELMAKSSTICLLSTTLSEAAVIIFTIAFCSIPILVVVPINCYLIKVSYRQMREIHDLRMSVEANLDQSNGTREQRDFTVAQKKIVKMVAVLVCLFLFLVAPITIIDLIETLGKVSVSPYLSKTAVCMIYLNTALNMFVYAAFNTTFREAFHRIFVQTRTFIDQHSCFK